MKKKAKKLSLKYHQIGTLFLLLDDDQRIILSVQNIKNKVLGAYYKVPKYLDSENFAVIYLKFKQRGQT